jgi:hypothetical protein
MAMHLLDRRESGWRCAYKIDDKILSFGQKRGLSITFLIHIAVCFDRIFPVSMHSVCV